MHDFSRRSAEREIIDDMTLDERTMAGILRELAVINRYLGGYATTLEALDELLPKGLARARVLDVGAGGGDMARRLVEWGRTRSMRLEVVSVDLSHGAVVFARDALGDVPDAGAKIHLYGKEVRHGRKVGHVTVTGADLESVLTRAREAADIVRDGALTGGAA